MNLEILVEERSAEHTLRALLPRIVPDVDFEVRVFRGKPDLLKKLPDRLKGYATWIPQADTCLVVLVDRDNDDCLTLKTDMEKMAAAAGLLTVTAAPVSSQPDMVNRIAVEELEAWFSATFQRFAEPILGFPFPLGSRRSTATLMRLQVARVRRWSVCFRRVVTTEVALRRSRQLPRSRNT